ncbi:MAG: IPTL-CTERM sorting domain-containing protein [Saprospiraceae bacterium]
MIYALFSLYKPKKIHIALDMIKPIKTNYLLILAFGLSPILITAQPEMSIWKVDHNSETPIFLHVNNENATLWDCGYEYYFTYPGPNVAHDAVLHILNEGSDTLLIEDPHLINPGIEYSLDLNDLNGEIKIAPDHELQMIVNYKAESYTNSATKLVITSNDISNPSCTVNFNVGQNIGSKSISDPCSCVNIVKANNSFGYLFRDTLILNSSGNVNWKLLSNDNPNGFVNVTGIPIATPLFFGSSNTGVTIKYVFYRFPDEQTRISFANQGNFLSNGVCASTCTIATVPTLSHWSLIVLTILVMIFGMVAMKNMNGVKE